MNVPSGKKAIVRVLGCKVNQAEAASMERILHEAGYSVDVAEPDPDLIVVNTCCVTKRAEGKARRLVKQLSEKHPRARFILTGCLAELSPEALDRTPNDHLVVGTAEKGRFSEFVKRLEPRPNCGIADEAGWKILPTKTPPRNTEEAGRITVPEINREGLTPPSPVQPSNRPFDRQDACPANGNQSCRPGVHPDAGVQPGHGTRTVYRSGARHARVFTDLGPAGITGRGRAFLKVQDGCSQRCTYCIVPFTRGPARSLPLVDAVGNARKLAGAGFSEIVLTGVRKNYALTE